MRGWPGCASTRPHLVRTPRSPGSKPVLLIHGEADDNTGTFPIQSERFYMALKGHGAQVRYVTLPHEAHGYLARESNFHVVAETLNWPDNYVRNAPRKVTERAGR